jgi:uncharacterized protein
VPIILRQPAAGRPMSVDGTSLMRYSVAQLLKEHSGAVRKYDVSEDVDGLDADIHALAPLTGQITLLRTADGVLVTGHLHTVVELECSRCLEPVVAPADFDLEEDFVPTIDVLTGRSLPIPVDADEATLIDEHHILDLAEAVRQNILLAQPSHPLCKTDCLGLCPVCGQNRNEGLCDCDLTERDPRWAVLADWMD